jgi:hypothetical protein
MKIEIIDASGPSVPLGFGGFFMHGMKIEPSEPQAEQPEFSFSPRERWLSRTAICARCDMRIHEAKGEANHTYFGDHGPYCPACALTVRMRFMRGKDLTGSERDAPKPQPLRIVGRPGPAMPARIRRTTEARKHHGLADPVWDVQFSLKFSADPSDRAPLTEPEGSIPALTTFLAKAEELEHYESTQCCPAHARGDLRVDHSSAPKDIATTIDVFRKNAIPVMSLNYQPREDPKVRALKADRGEPLPAFIRLPDRVIEDRATGMTYTEPRFGDAKYIAAMERRIGWERWRSQNGPLLTATFGRLRSGQLSIEALGKDHDDEAKLTARRALKAAWLAAFGSLPTVAEWQALVEQAKGKRAIAHLTEEERYRWERRAIDDPEDADPGRVGFHADPDPAPTRDQYPFGDHRFCELTPAYLNIPDVHRGCTDDGWDLYNADLAVWQHAATERGDIGYAGPHGGLGIDAKDKSYNPFFRPEEDDSERGAFAPSIQRWRTAASDPE